MAELRTAFLGAAASVPSEHSTHVWFGGRRCADGIENPSLAQTPGPPDPLPAPAAAGPGRPLCTQPLLPRPLRSGSGLEERSDGRYYRCPPPPQLADLRPWEYKTQYLWGQGWPGTRMKVRFPCSLFVHVVTVRTHWLRYQSPARRRGDTPAFEELQATRRERSTQALAHPSPEQDDEPAACSGVQDRGRGGKGRAVAFGGTQLTGSPQSLPGYSARPVVSAQVKGSSLSVFPSVPTSTSGN